MSLSNKRGWIGVIAKACVYKVISLVYTTCTKYKMSWGIWSRYETHSPKDRILQVTLCVRLCVNFVLLPFRYCVENANNEVNNS